MPGGVAQEWVRNHDPRGHVAVYTDGSVLFPNRGRNGAGCGGAGVFACRGDKQLFAMSIALGPAITSGKAEMEALTLGVEKIVKYCKCTDTGTLEQIYFFSDSTNALRNIHHSYNHNYLAYHTRFYLAIAILLLQHPNLKVTLEWVPAHQRIYGNERADRLAKSGSRRAREIYWQTTRSAQEVKPPTRSYNPAQRAMTSQRWPPRATSRN